MILLCVILRRKWQPTPVFLPGESQGLVSLVGCHLWGHTESDTTEATFQQQQKIQMYCLPYVSLWTLRITAFLYLCFPSMSWIRNCFLRIFFDSYLLYIILLVLRFLLEPLCHTSVTTGKMLQNTQPIIYFFINIIYWACLCYLVRVSLMWLPQKYKGEQGTR